MVEIPKFPELTFDEATHLYRLNGVELPSVTTVMKPLSTEVYGGVDEWVMERAAGRGTAVHNAIENWSLYGIEDIAPEDRRPALHYQREGGYGGRKDHLPAPRDAGEGTT